MSVNRFGWLLSHMDLNDNSVQPKSESHDYDKLYKVRPLIKTLSQTFLKCYSPSKYQAIDECMIKFKGRSGIKQYMKDKPIKRGYKAVSYTHLDVYKRQVVRSFMESRIRLSYFPLPRI